MPFSHTYDGAKIELKCEVDLPGGSPEDLPLIPWKRISIHLEVAKEDTDWPRP